jgi:deoxyribonuclease V
MHPSLDDDWSPSLDEARRIQEILAGQVSQTDDLGSVRTIAGIDLGYPRTASGAVISRAAIVVLRFPELELVEEQVALRAMTFPHVRGLLSFRAAPVVLAALSQLRVQPDLLFVNGHGRSHPRRLGIASHLGVLLDLPSIGCARSILIGQAAEPGMASGDRTPLFDGDEVIGMALRTRAGSRPIYISPGHRVSVDTAAELVMRCARGFRLPEPTRLAHRLASQRPRTQEGTPNSDTRE